MLTLPPSENAVSRRRPNWPPQGQGVQRPSPAPSSAGNRRAGARRRRGRAAPPSVSAWEGLLRKRTISAMPKPMLRALRHPPRALRERRRCDRRGSARSSVSVVMACKPSGECLVSIGLLVILQPITVSWDEQKPLCSKARHGSFHHGRFDRLFRRPRRRYAPTRQEFSALRTPVARIYDVTSSLVTRRVA